MSARYPGEYPAWDNPVIYVHPVCSWTSKVKKWPPLPGPQQNEDNEASDTTASKSIPLLETDNLVRRHSSIHLESSSHRPSNAARIASLASRQTVEVAHQSGKPTMTTEAGGGFRAGTSPIAGADVIMNSWPFLDSACEAFEPSWQWELPHNRAKRRRPEGRGRAQPGGSARACTCWSWATESRLVRAAQERPLQHVAAHGQEHSRVRAARGALVRAAKPRAGQEAANLADPPACVRARDAVAARAVQAHPLGRLLGHDVARPLWCRLQLPVRVASNIKALAAAHRSSIPRSRFKKLILLPGTKSKAQHYPSHEHHDSPVPRSSCCKRNLYPAPLPVSGRTILPSASPTGDLPLQTRQVATSGCYVCISQSPVSERSADEKPNYQFSQQPPVMATHLAHKLPWSSVSDFYRQRSVQQSLRLPEAKKVELQLNSQKAMEHFARCFSTTLKEFIATDAPSDQEREQYDPNTWPGVNPYSQGAWMGYYMSLLVGYWELNLILSDPEVFLPLVLFGREQRTWTMDVLCGACDGGHPPWLADHIKQVFDERRQFKPLTAEVVQIIRDHVALLFRCMCRISGGNNKLLDPVFVVYELSYS